MVVDDARDEDPSIPSIHRSQSQDRPNTTTNSVQLFSLKLICSGFTVYARWVYVWCAYVLQQVNALPARDRYINTTEHTIRPTQVSREHKMLYTLLVASTSVAESPDKCVAVSLLFSTALSVHSHPRITLFLTAL